MFSKEKLRKKYINIRKKRYFDTKDISFKPLIKFISIKQIKKIQWKVYTLKKKDFKVR